MSLKSIDRNPKASLGCLAVMLTMLLCSNTCKGQDDSSSQVAEYVGGGSRAPRRRFPYMCSIRKQASEVHLCGGTLINDSWIMTAAHCLDPDRSDSAGMSPTVYCNIYKREEQTRSKKFAPSRCYLHHLWDGNVLNGNDIALCQLDRSATFDIPRLSNIGDNFAKGDAFSVLGWGSTGSTSDFADVLQIGFPLLYLAPSACNLMGDWTGRIKDSMICAGRGNPNTCKGDSGGPLFLRHDPENRDKDEDPQFDVIVGITSFGDDDCEADLPSVYTRISCYRTWIECIVEGTGQDCSDHAPCGEDSSSSSGGSSSLCSGIQKSATFTEADALERIRTAIPSDEAGTVEEILCEGLSANAVYGIYNNSLLIAAAENDAIGSATVLLQNGAEIEYKNSYGAAALHMAAEDGSVRVTQLLIDNDANVETKSDAGRTPLAHAAINDHLEVAQIFLENGAKPENKDNERFAPLHFAALFNSREVVTLLLEYGVNIESKTIMGHTPLHLAAQQNSFDVAKLLIENGAEIESKDVTGFTPLHAAAEFNSIEVAKELIANSADIEAENYFGVCPLHVASEYRSLSLVRLLLDENAMVDFMDNAGTSALHRAAARGHISVVRVLLDNGASKTLANNDGDTPFDVICDEPYPYVEEPCRDNAITILRQLLEP